jgi:hypothetical protein
MIYYASADVQVSTNERCARSLARVGFYSEAVTRRDMFAEGNRTSAPPPGRTRMGVAGTDRPRYEKGARGWVQSARDAHLPGVVIGHYLDWNMYRVVYMVDVGGQGPRAVEEWRLSPRRVGEER